MCFFCLPFGLIDVLSMQQTPAYSRHTLHQDRRADKSGRPLHRHHSLGERHSYNTITHWPQVLCFVSAHSADSSFSEAYPKKYCILSDDRFAEAAFDVSNVRF